jgi:hypothetical protein
VVFQARYPGWCDTCGNEIEVGDEVTYSDDELVHEDCYDDDDPFS